MKETKIIEILKTFSKDELRELEKFISSPYHRRRDVENLFGILKPFYPEFENKKLSNEYVFERLYPGKKFGDKKSDSLLKTLTSELYLICKDFLVQLELNEHQTFQKYFLLTQLRKRKLHKEFVKESASAKQRFEIKGGEAFDFLEKYYLTCPFLEYYIDTNDFGNCYEMIISQNEYLTAAALTKSYRFADQKNAAETGYNLTTRQSLSQSMIKSLDIVSLINELKKDNSIFHPYIEVSYLSHLLMTGEENTDHYFRMKELLFKHHDLFSHSEKYFFFSAAANYGNIIFSKTKNQKFRREIFEIYDGMLKLGFYKYSPGDYLQVGLFRSMLIEARISKEYEWMKNLIEKYVGELHPDHRESMKQYSTGQYFFAIGEYGKALESLITLKSDYFLYKKDLKNLLFRIYYSLELYEEAYSMLDNMKHYLSSTHDLSENIRSKSLNFVKYASELLRIKTGIKKDAKEFMRKKIEKAKDIESWEWLVEKLDEMK